jgi:radical SAM enzyme (TIGR01210 family)
MKPDAINKQIIFGSQKAGKTYTFDEEHDQTLPAQMWFQESDEGLILFIVFYTQACRWSRCLGCNLPSKVSQNHVPYKSLMAQIDNVFADPGVCSRRPSIRKVIASNNGSVLDEDTFSSTALMYLIAQLNINFPNLAVLSMESRPEYVDLAELEFISRALGEGETPTQLEIAIGFEAFDNRIRNEVFDKGLSLEVFEGLVRKMSPYGYHLKCYFMQKPVPDMSDAEAVADIKNAIDYLGRIANKYAILINMHLNPTYVAAGTAMETAFWEGRYTPPFLEDVAEAVRHAREKSISTFIGLSDEDLAVKGGSFLSKGNEALVEKLELFNRTHDFDILDEICKKRKAGL